MEELLQVKSNTIARMIELKQDVQVRAALAYLIADTAIYMNITNNMDQEQIAQTIDRIIATYGDYKPEHFQLCFDRAKIGRYGKVFNRFDGMIIFEWLGKFDIELQEEIMQKRSDQSKSEKENAKSLLTMGFHPNVIKAIDKALDESKKANTPKDREKSEEEKMIQRWIVAFDKMHLSKGKAITGIKVIPRFGEWMTVNDWLEYKMDQYNRVINRIND